MTSYLGGDGVGYPDSGEFTVSDLADDYGFEAEDGDLNEVIDRLMYGVMLMDKLHGDDPTKFEAFEHFVVALRILEESGDGEISGNFDWSDGSMGVRKVPRDPSELGL